MSADIYDDWDWDWDWDWDGLPEHLASAITFYMVNHGPGWVFRGKAQPIFSV